MSHAEAMALLSSLRTPLLVGDPEGHIVYVNPSFCSAFRLDRDDPVGQPLAMLFSGGAQDAVMSATAAVLDLGQAARFQISEAGTAYSALVSPIEARDDRVGVMMVLLEEQSIGDSASALAEQIRQPLGTALESLESLAPELRSRLGPSDRELLGRALGALEDAQETVRELQRMIHRGKSKPARFDVSTSILRVAERAAREFGGGVHLEVLLPPNLPRAVGDAAAFERLIGQLLRKRADEGQSGQPLTLLARALGVDELRGVLVSLVDSPDATRRDPTGRPPEALTRGIAEMGGETICVEDSEIGRVTSVRLAIAGV